MSRQCPECGSHYGNVLTEYPHEYFSCLHCGNVNDKYIGVAKRSHDIETIADQVNTLSSIASFEGSIPRRYEHRLQQLTGEVRHLQNLVTKKKRHDL